MLELHVSYRDGGEERLLAKGTAVAPLCSTPAWLHDTGREAEVYRDILLRAGGAVPRLRLVTRRWLVVEHVDGTVLTDIGGAVVWADVARQLAIFHHKLGEARSERLLRWDADLVAAWALRAARLTRNSLLRAIAQRRSALAERLAAQPAGFLHGELFPANVVVRPDGGACFVDWELSAVGPQLLDLAALVSGSWSERERLELALAYRSALSPRPPIGRFLSQLDACRLVVALRMLGWAADWEPPPEHRHDWLVDVADLAERLELL